MAADDHARDGTQVLSSHGLQMASELDHDCNLSGMKIILAQTSSFSFIIFRSLLNQLGIENIIKVSDAQELLNTLRGGQFDVVLMDLHLPPSAMSMTSLIRRTVSRDRQPIILLTCDADPREDVFLHIEHAAKIFQADGLMQQPISKEQVRAELLKISQNVRPILYN